MAVNVAIWEFRVKPERQAEFERRYGPDGDWVRLFRRSSGYLGTQLLQDRAMPLRYVTTDRWASLREWQSFREQHGAAYAALDRECEGLTDSERALGEYDEAAAAASPN